MKPINTPSDSYKLAMAVVQSARYLEQHVRFSGDHNKEMLYAMVDAAAKVSAAK